MELGDEAARDRDELASGKPTTARFRARLPFWLLAIAVVAVMLVATRPWESMFAGSPAVDPSNAAQAVQPPPEVGKCYAYSSLEYSQAITSSAPVPCDDSAHTAYTVAVLLPIGIPLPYDSSRDASNAAMQKCQSAVDEFTGVGSGVEFSLFTGAVFEPQGDQLANDQRWLRCDVVEAKPDDGSLQPLPSQIEAVMMTGPDSRDALCVLPTASAQVRSELGGYPASRQWPTRVDCDLPGAVVAVRSQRTSAVGTPWSGSASARLLGGRACRMATSHFVGLTLRPLIPPKRWWSPTTLCVADPAAYRIWVAKGKKVTHLPTLAP